MDRTEEVTDPVPAGPRREAGDPEVSVVIPVRNGGAELDEQLAALADQTCAVAWEVVVADNGSTDGTVVAAEAWANRLPVRVVDASDVRGVGHARNIGVRAALGRFIAICDADDVVDPRWLEELVAVGRSYDLVAGTLEFDRLNPRPETGTTQAPLVDFPLWGMLPFAIGANMGFRREVFDALGGWDETFIGGGDDIEFSWRAQLAGFQLGFAPDAVVHYRFRSSLRALARQNYARSKTDPQVYGRFRVHGMPRSPVAAALKAWLWVLVVAPRALVGRRDDVRSRWVLVASKRAGRLVGSVHYRVLYL
jgi:glycosyltransferase involved in cell wall biosynthesis